MNDDLFPEPFGPHYERPRPADCPKCPCHTRRVCEGAQWHLADRPVYADGTPYNEPCPCEQAAAQPENRMVAIELDGVLRMVSAQYHRVGLLAGGMLTDRVFRAESAEGRECPVSVPMVLLTPNNTVDPRLIVIDSRQEKWVMSFTAQHNLQRYQITGWCSTEDA
ncbi:hypothetical protein [Streptomyces sp. UNOC14_S4]|uniref:hypothetical protein n=1 Tax=Streptomyces sp. UNOC14_S4 TaxID=2872340 RepID=UPI001E312ED2|nr:hypothetical protein [Streptomyces sp. UNOC14_S4]MCC3767287.1 hypothetical protein [Streptomyces sp. UNOC14_S4]